MAFRTETVSVRDGMFSVEMRCGGSGKPLMWLHHSGGHQAWYPFMDALAEKYTVYQPDHPGWGDSTGLEHLDDIIDMAIFYLDFFDAIGVEKPFLVGHSLGGMIAAEVAALDNDSVAKLVLVDAAGLYTYEIGGEDLFTMQQDQMMKALAVNPASLAAMAPALNREDRAAMARAMFERQKALAAAGKFLWPIWDKGLKKRIHRIKAPTLILWGAHDGIVPPGYAAQFQRLIKGSKLHMFQNSAHMPMFEEPGEFLAQVTGFLG